MLFRKAGGSINRGFTLWEMLLVLLILSMVVYIAIPSFLTTFTEVKTKADKANILKLEKAVHLYYLDSGQYPDSLDQLLFRSPDNDKWNGPYLEEIPKYPLAEDKSYAVTVNGVIIVKDSKIKD